MKKIICIFCILILLTSCMYKLVGKINDLGNNFVFVGGGRDCLVLYNENKKQLLRGTGLEVIPPEIEMYNYDSTYIVAKTIEYIAGRRISSFWIVDKRQGYKKPIVLDSLQYLDSLEILKVKLKLKDRALVR